MNRPVEGWSRCKVPGCAAPDGFCARDAATGYLGCMWGPRPLPKAPASEDPWLLTEEDIQAAWDEPRCHEGTPVAGRDGGFCTHCGHEIESFDGLSACPACGTNGIPCAHANQVDVSVNWHELRILCIWAENYARNTDDVPSSVVYAIARRLQAQHPDRGPLTLAGELGELGKHHKIDVSDPRLRQDIAEQTGVETGLIPPPDSETAP